MSHDPVLPPATGTWWEPAATLAAVLHTLRLEGGDVDVAPVTAAIEAASGLIDQYIDSATVVSTVPAPVQQALEQLAIELYRRKDAPFNTLGGTDAPGVLLVEDTIATVEPLLRPYRLRWGIA